jgi:hypothetical protein
MDVGTLEIYYKSEEGIDTELEDDLSDVLAKHGYSEQGSGIMMASGIRDIEFIKEVTNGIQSKER